MESLAIIVYFINEVIRLANSWPGVIFLLTLIVIVVVVFKDELTPLVQQARDGLRALFGGGKPESVSARRCPNNPAHLLDPNWEVCPYCENERRAKEKSAGLENVPSSVRVRDRTAVGRKLPVGDERVTRDTTSGVGSGGTRRIVGAMVTYTWRPEGQLFQVYEGRNFIGRADMSGEAAPRPCDIQMPQDTQMSAEHALILCRQGHYEIIDQETTNGTLVNGELLKANLPAELRNYAKIRTGTTEWTFITIDAPQKVAVVPPPPPGGKKPTEVQ